MAGLKGKSGPAGNAHAFTRLLGALRQDKLSSRLISTAAIREETYLTY
jgi:hypothetical protein